jgi:hypothetical protein
MQKDTPDIEHTLSLIGKYYNGKKSVGLRTLEEHCRRVANFSQTIAAKLFVDVKNENFSNDVQANIAAVAHAGLLHEAINTGACSFEDIAENTTVQIADIVSNISRDFRLIETKRDIEFRGRVCQSSIATQIVALADIIVTAKEIMDAISKNGLAAVMRPRKILIRLDGDLLSLHAVPRYYVLRLYAHAARNLLTDVSQLIKDKKKAARKDKANAATIAAIKRNIAAKQVAVDKAVSNPKRKGKAHG